MRPLRILLCILSTFIVLGAVCALYGGRSELVRVPELSSVLSLPEWPQQTDTLLAEVEQPADTLPTIADTLAIEHVEQQQVDSTSIKPQPTKLPAPLPQTTLQLPAFYAALAHADRQSVRVVHFGDSQIEEDRISMILRQRLQERFGGGGIGLIPMVQTIPSCTAKQGLEQDGSQLPNSAVKRYVAYGLASMRMRESNYYGPMAQVAWINEPIDVNIELRRDRVPTNAYDRIRILSSDSVMVSLVPDSLEQRRIAIAAAPDDTVSDASMRQDILVLPSPQRSSLLHFEGEGYVYGLSLETATGVQVDNVPMRGAAGTNFTTMARKPFASYFRATNTALLILQFGGNALPALRNKAAVEKYVLSMRQQIHYMHAAAPNASLLFIGPSDMITTVEGELQTYPLLPLLDSLLAQMVAEEGGAYYSLFRLMGGAASMISWRDKGLAGDDMIHFTRAGAKKVGEMLAKQILEDFDKLSEVRSGSLDDSELPND